MLDSRPPTPQPTAPILVVDDDEQIRRLFAAALGRAGFQTIEAADGQAALDIAEHQPLGLVVLDVRMPGLSGLDVIRAMRGRQETVTTPILLVTSDAGDDGVVLGLEAGADDFLAKPVRLDELVARVRARLRSSQAWTDTFAAELHSRAQAIVSLAQMPASMTLEDTAIAVVRELVATTSPVSVVILRRQGGSRLLPLISYRGGSMRSGGRAPSAARSAELLARLASGPWLIEPDITGPDGGPSADTAAVTAYAPIYAGLVPVGLLVAGTERAVSTMRGLLSTALLASVIDYAAVLSARIGTALAEEALSTTIRHRLTQVIQSRAFDIAFQPIVELQARRVVGYEALTRFHDGTPPDLRFAEATAAGLGPQLELTVIESAIGAAAGLPAEDMVTINSSPDVVLEPAPLRSLLRRARQPVVLELTEHHQIPNYAELRAAIGELGPGIRIAVDDAGAGYASLRHILELAPDFAKIDISITHAIEADPLRQAMVAGLVHYALLAGCVLIGEGIETEAEHAALAALGVELGQGYLFGRPATR